MTAKIMLIPETTPNAQGALFAPDEFHGIPSRFIPNKLAINVGMDSTSVIAVNNFMTMFRLLLMIDPQESIVPAKMSRYIVHISIACKFSV